MQNLKIRPATRADCATILAFITGLAKYEKLEHEVVATEQRLQESLFGEQPAAEVLIAELPGSPVGFALFFQTYSTFLAQPGLYLEDLFVLPEYRGRGFGKALLVAVAKVARQRNCGRLEWSVLDWNEPAIRFYEALGAVPLTEWTTNRVTGPALARLAES